MYLYVLVDVIKRFNSTRLNIFVKVILTEASIEIIVERKLNHTMFFTSLEAEPLQAIVYLYLYQ